MKKHSLIPTGLPATLSAAALASASAFAAPFTAGLLLETEGGVLSAPATAKVAQDSESQFGEPVTVNGVRISDLAIKRYLVYGPGRNALDARKLQILMDHERKLRRTEVRDRILDDGADLDDAALEAAIDARMKDFDFDAGAVTRRLEKEKASFSERYPTLDYETELRRAYRSGNWYRDQVRQTTEFDQLFFPGHPDGWPALSIEAINLGSPQVDLIADYQKEYERRLQVSLDTGEPIVPEQEMMMQIMRDFVMSALWSLADVKTASDGIPEDVVMIIDGGDWTAEIKTEDVFSEMEKYFSAQDIDDAKLVLALMEAARQKLAAEGALLDIEEFRETVNSQREAMAPSMFNFDFMALQGHGFPSSEAYEEHFHLVESYKAMRQDVFEASPEGGLNPELQAHLPIANGIMGLAKCHADTLLVSAFDFQGYEWKEDGWQQAYDKAHELRAAVDAQLAKSAAADKARALALQTGQPFESDVMPFDRWWTDFLRQNSDFWDPPLPAVGKGPPEFGLKNYGAFRDQAMTRNDMKRAIGESEYEHFLSNGAIVDTMFFDMEPGTVAGPFRGPQGYYIVYLKARSAPTNPLNLQTENHKAMLREDWLRKSFQAFSHDALANAELTGL